jgi:8-oxo-dGTP diphosphatase
MQQSVSAVRDLVAAIVPGDEQEWAHRADCLAWLERTDDIYRRVRPATPPKHLVSYAVLIDPGNSSVFLVDHLLSGLQLPSGGHVEPGENPLDTARRETLEELGIEADLSIAGVRPAFLTVTRTVGLDAGHTDVSLWYAISGRRQMALALDQRAFAGGRWWPVAEIESADPARFDPHLGRFLAKIAPRLGGEEGE